MNEDNTSQETLDTPEVIEETQTQPTDAVTPEVLAKELERARKEAAKYRTRLREREEAEQKALEEQRMAEQTAEERARELQHQLEQAKVEAERRIQTAERKSQLAGKVSNPDRVLKLMDDADAYFDGVAPDVDRILADFPEYSVTPSQSVAPAPTGPSPVRKVSMERLAEMTAEEINANWDALVASTKGTP